MDKYPSVLDLNKLKQEMNLSDEAIKNSGFTPEDLQTIYSDYLGRLPNLENLKNNFIFKYIAPAKGVRIHSYGGRVKSPTHLIEKIIRKRSTNDSKYKNMTVSDYYKYITDLIGCRILLVYKDDWKEVHNYLIQTFPNNSSAYIDQSSYVSSYDNACQFPFMAEAPVVHMRIGDAEIYPEDMVKVERGKYYRSLHYIVRINEYYVEIQVRTLFEEAWGEVDHDVLYPYHKDDTMLVNFSTLINRAAGMSDEMSAYFKTELSQREPINRGILRDVPLVFDEHNLETLPPFPTHSAIPIVPQDPNESTPDKILSSIIYGKKV